MYYNILLFDHLELFYQTNSWKYIYKDIFNNFETKSIGNHYSAKRYIVWLNVALKCI